MTKAPKKQGLRETIYTSRYYGRQSPVLINYLARRNNVAAAPVDAPFTYLDLGCGNGVSLNTLAAASPNSQFFGIDLMPEHIANANRMATEGGIKNATFIEFDFRDMATLKLPKFDYITLHGVYSWVSEKERKDIRDLIGRLLKPNGLVYVSYNALPGSAVIQPLRDLFKQYADAVSGSATERAAEAVKFLTNLKDNGAKYVKDNPAVSDTIDDLKERDINYVAHEYLSDNYTTFSVKTVAAEMAEESLKFCCGMPQAPAWIRRSQLRKFRYLLSSRSTQLAKETLTSVLLNESFRADIYCRTNHDSVDGTSVETFMPAIFGSTNLLPLAHPPSRNLNVEANKILDMVSPGDVSMQAISETPDAQLPSIDRLCEFIHYMVEDKLLHPFARPAKDVPAETPDSYRIASAFNRNILNSHLIRTGHCALASPVIGDGVGIDLITGLFLLSLTDETGEKPVTYVDRMLKASGRYWRRNGVAVKDPSERTALLTEDLDHFTEYRLPLLIRLGIVEPMGIEAVIKE
ncbi:MAG: methyltransferase domain-containing protein [Alphaproteobacteria bacterium]|jgi:SAM-dependent methyltransferase|nr:methyltransferase domain-containing protein [Alphaproteobacteria bacterium]MBT4019953.1 methyltransferase domain-containing protein [Alphaproteobacteria bacterium]MBT4966752.1 methyltransferase domain-containing protein [Alphaproteobacteria bacterium]MBT5158443.1 methyltransferase domain-containing protein [Alphaproteobacteria bacterium]